MADMKIQRTDIEVTIDADFCDALNELGNYKDDKYIQQVYESWFGLPYSTIDIDGYCSIVVMTFDSMSKVEYDIDHLKIYYKNISIKTDANKIKLIKLDINSDKVTIVCDSGDIIEDAYISL